MHHVVAPFAQDAPKAAAERKKIPGHRTPQNSGAESFDFLRVHSGLLPEGAKIELDPFSIAAFQHTQQPGFHSAGIECS
jgi:hypothetical protein